MSLNQQATITKIEDGKIFLSVCRPDACSACKAKSACSMDGSGKEAIVDDDGQGREVGDEVTLKIRRSQGIMAVIVAYLVPVFLMIGLLLGLREFGVSEVNSGISAIGAVIVYYIVLRLLRRRLETEFTIEIE